MQITPPCAASLLIGGIFVMKSESKTVKFTDELKLFGNAKVLAISGLLAAASLILAFLAKSIFGTGPLRLTFENLPVFLAGFIFGPTVGAATALCADLISCIITGMAPLPLVTFGAVAVGAVSGTVFRYILPNADIRISVPAAVLSGHAVGSMLIKSIGLYNWFGSAVYLRIPLYVVISIFESVLLIILLKNRSFMAQVGKVVKRK